jgi:hypothetical protein
MNAPASQFKLWEAPWNFGNLIDSAIQFIRESLRATLASVSIPVNSSLRFRHGCRVERYR